MIRTQNSRLDTPILLPTIALPMIACALLLTGCITGRGSWKIPSVDDPPSLSPRNQSLYRPSPSAAPKIAAPSPRETRKEPQPDDSRRKPSVRREKNPATDDGDQLPARRPTSPGGTAIPREGNQGPAIVPQGVTIPARLELVVNAPPKRQVGSAATFRLTVRNIGDKPADAVVVRCRFPDGLVFPGSRERQVTRRLGRLPSGKSRTFSLTLRGEKTGSLCCEFEVSSQGAERAWKSVCVKFVPRSLEVTVLGPRNRTLGSRAEFTIKLSNTSSQALKNVRTTLRQDAALVPKEASKGVTWDKDALRWNLGSIGPGAEVQLQVEFDCHKTSDSACFALEVTADNFAGDTAEQCLKIDKSPGVIIMQVRDRNDLLQIGDETEYLVTISNTGLQSVRGIQLTTEIPDMFRIVSAEVRQEKHRLLNTTDITGRTVTFGPVATLRGGDTLHYRIRVKAFSAGDGTFRARMSHSLKKNNLTVSESTTVNPPASTAAKNAPPPPRFPESTSHPTPSP